MFYKPLCLFVCVSLSVYLRTKKSGWCFGASGAGDESQNGEERKAFERGSLALLPLLSSPLWIHIASDVNTNKHQLSTRTQSADINTHTTHASGEMVVVTAGSQSSQCPRLTYWLLPSSSTGSKADSLCWLCVRQSLSCCKCVNEVGWMPTTWHRVLRCIGVCGNRNSNQGLFKSSTAWPSMMAVNGLSRPPLLNCDIDIFSLFLIHHKCCKLTIWMIHVFILVASSAHSFSRKHFFVL